MLKYLVVLFLGGLMTGCSTGTTDSSEILFDTRSFFEAQLDSLKEQHYGLVKVMHFGEKKDRIYLDSLKWETELAPFTAIDLRKPAYTGRFLADSVVEANRIILHYHRNDKVTDIEDVWIYKQDSTITQIKIVFEEKNQLYASAKELVFTSDSGFEISGSQSVKLSPPVTYHVKGIFKKPIVNQ